MASLAGSVALVTGGGRGIGAAIATRLAEGAAVVAVTDRDIDAAGALAESLAARGLGAEAFVHDVTSWSSAQRVVAAVERTLGPIDVLVNNAGVSRYVPFLEIEEDEWDRVLDINLKGVYLTSRAVLPGMIERRRGRVVNMSSVCGKLGIADFSHYCASKFGVIGLTQAVASEVAEHGITVNAVCPGIVDTPLKSALLEDMVAGQDDIGSAAEAHRQFTSVIPLGAPQPAEDVAEMVAFLVSEHGRNMTGGSYHVDGGLAPR